MRPSSNHPGPGTYFTYFRIICYFPPTSLASLRQAASLRAPAWIRRPNRSSADRSRISFDALLTPITSEIAPAVRCPVRRWCRHSLSTLRSMCSMSALRCAENIENRRELILAHPEELRIPSSSSRIDRVSLAERVNCGVQVQLARMLQSPTRLSRLVCYPRCRRTRGVGQQLSCRSRTSTMGAVKNLDLGSVLELEGDLRPLLSALGCSNQGFWTRFSACASALSRGRERRICRSLLSSACCSCCCFSCLLCRHTPGTPEEGHNPLPGRTCLQIRKSFVLPNIPFESVLTV